MKTMTVNRTALSTAWTAEMAFAASARHDGDVGRAWDQIERAHIVSRTARRTSRPHPHRDARPCGAHWQSADVSAFAPMPIPADLRHLLET